MSVRTNYLLTNEFVLRFAKHITYVTIVHKSDRKRAFIFKKIALIHRSILFIK